MATNRRRTLPGGLANDLTETERSALGHLSRVAGVVALLALLAYVVPGLEPYRAWIPGEPVPLAVLFDFDRAEVSSSPAVAAPSSAPSNQRLAQREIERQLGSAVSANLEGDEDLDSEAPSAHRGPHNASGKPGGSASPASSGPGAAQPPSPTPGPGLAGVQPSPGQSPPLSAAPGAPAVAQPTPDALVISEEDLAAVARSIEDPSGRALDRFLSRLIAVGRGEKRIVRVAHYGDSTIALDGITSTMRRRLQRRFGDAGHGFVLGGKGYLPYGHKDVKFFDNEQWELDTITRGGRSDGSFGYGATLFRSPGGAKTTYATVTDAPVGGEVSRFEVFFQAHRRGGKLELTVDGGEPVVVSTRTGEAEPEFVDKWHMLEVAPGPHTLVARAAGGGEVRLYGVALERGESGVVYDSLGIVGARASRLLNASAEHMAAQLRHRDLSLLVLQFGGNEAVDRSMKMDWYYNKLTEVVKFMRTAAGDVDCLLLAPLDQGERDDRGRVRTIPIVPKMIEVQRQVAQEQGCAYWDTFQAMGGEGSMGRWYDAKPRLGWGDFIHATPKGYEVIGNMLYKAVLEKLAAKL